MNKRLTFPQIIICTLMVLFFVTGVILFIGSLVAYLFSQGGQGEIESDYMGGVIVTNDLSAYSTITFMLSIVCFSVAGFFSKKLK